MKLTLKISSALLFLFLFSCSDNSDSTTLEGEYHGKNLFVQNPFGEDGIGFCVKTVLVNGKVTSDEINSAAFEVDLAAMGLKEGDNVKVEITYSPGCKPKILNPEVLN